jgi:hypothetical protein
MIAARPQPQAAAADCAGTTPGREQAHEQPLPCARGRHRNILGIFLLIFGRSHARGDAPAEALTRYRVREVAPARARTPLTDYMDQSLDGLSALEMTD